LDRALADFEQAIRLSPELPSSYNNRGEIDLKKHDFDRTIADQSKALLLAPDMTYAYTDRGLAFEAKGDLARARADFNAALASRPGPSIWAPSVKIAVDTARERLAAISTTSAVPAATAPVPPMGGLAAGTCDRVGWATGFADANEARKAILDACASTGDKACRIVAPIQGDCAAFAMAGACGTRAWANGPDRKQAEETALSSCTAKGGRDCTIRRSVCDGED
jgi:tetratricopeptide (TPR) repeat protein